MSEFYLKSPWCIKEVEWFVSEAATRGIHGPLFVVRAFETNESRWPDSLKDRQGNALPGYTFHTPASRHGLSEPLGWPKPDFTDKDYWKALKKIALALTEQLRSQSSFESRQRTETVDGSMARPDASEGGQGTSTQVSSKRVFLGLFHDTLNETRNELRDALRNLQITVLPPETEDPDALSLEGALDSYLDEADAFVLAVNEFCSLKRGEPGGIISFQINNVGRKHKPQFLWMKVTNADKITNKAYREYLEYIAADGVPEIRKLEGVDTEVAVIASQIAAQLDHRNIPAPNLAVVCANAAGQDLVYAEFLKAVESAVEDTNRLPVTKTFDPKNDPVLLSQLQEEIKISDALLVVCFDQDWIWAGRFLRHMVQLSGPPTEERKRVFVVGPKDLGKGLLRGGGARFRTIDGLCKTASGIKEEIKRELQL